MPLPVPASATSSPPRTAPPPVATVFDASAETRKAATRLEHLSNIWLDDGNKPRLTSIIGTIGPSSNQPEMIVNLRKAGLNIVRMNFSHGSHEYAKSILDNIAKSYQLHPGREVAIALDTKGPEVRTGVNASGEDVVYEANTEVTVSTAAEDKDKQSPTLLYFDYAQLAQTVKLGQVIYVADGNLTLRVTAADAATGKLTCVTLNKYKLGSKKNVNLPGCVLDLPAVSAQDKLDLAWGTQNNVDMVFASFVRRAADVHAIREALVAGGERGQFVKIIAKIENFEGLRNFSEILDAVDGVMVARGDLGMDLSPQKVFLAQKMMIARCNMAGKPVICATQMLESMINNPRPTRAEATDVANAVLDGADCVMLSGETANGKYPEACVSFMAQICAEAERAVWNDNLCEELIDATPLPISTTESIAVSAVTATFQQNIAAIIVLTTSGESARWLAKYRPRCPVICVTRQTATARQLQLHRGCVPMLYPKPAGDDWHRDVQDRLVWALRSAIDIGLVQSHINDPNANIIAITGWKRKTGHTNTMRVLGVDLVLSDAFLAAP